LNPELKTWLQARRSNSLDRVIGFHGCSQSVAEKLLAVGTWNPDKTWWQPSNQTHDWLGDGMYFWMDSPHRAYEWSMDKAKNGAYKNDSPCLIGALIQPSLCLNLLDSGVIDEIQLAFEHLQALRLAAGVPLPQNTLKDAQGFKLLRRLDNEVLRTVHQLREDKGEAAYDTVMGFFEEGDAAFNGSTIRAKNHVQIAVRNPESVIGFFRVV
jgi:hypothetical protein